LILAVNGPDDEAYTRLFAVNTRGQVVRHFLTIRGPSDGLAWGRYGLAVGYQIAHPSMVIDMSGRVLARLPGAWIPGCWNPAGTRLLVTAGTGGGSGSGIWPVPAKSATWAGCPVAPLRNALGQQAPHEAPDTRLRPKPHDAEAWLAVAGLRHVWRNHADWRARKRSASAQIQCFPRYAELA